MVSIMVLYRLLLMDLCYNKSNNSLFPFAAERENRRDSALLDVCRRDLVSPRNVLPLPLCVFISFRSLCCVPGEEVKIAFALQVMYVGVYKWHYKQILL